jgi:hypothetical protein
LSLKVGKTGISLLIKYIWMIKFKKYRFLCEPFDRLI